MTKLTNSEKLLMKEKITYYLDEVKDSVLYTDENKIFFIGTKRDLLNTIENLIVKQVKSSNLDKNDVEMMFGVIMEILHLNLNNILNHKKSFHNFIK